MSGLQMFLLLLWCGVLLPLICCGGGRRSEEDGGSFGGGGSGGDSSPWASLDQADYPYRSAEDPNAWRRRYFDR